MIGAMRRREGGVVPNIQSVDLVINWDVDTEALADCLLVATIELPLVVSALQSLPFGVPLV